MYTSLLPGLYEGLSRLQRQEVHGCLLPFLEKQQMFRRRAIFTVPFSNMQTVCSRRIMQKACYYAVNHVADLFGNKCVVMEGSKHHVPEL